MRKNKIEFDEFLEKLRNESDMRQIDKQVIEAADTSKKIKYFSEQEEKISYKKKSKKTYRIKSGALTFLMLLGFVSGVGAKSLYDEVAPVVKVFVQNQADNINLAGWFENFDVSKNGYYLNMEVKREKNDSFFDDGPEPFDFSNPENLSVTTDGRKVGAIVDYYDAFDEYLDEFTGTGYYEIKYQQMQRLVSIGKDPNAVDCIYSYEELSDMLSNDKGMGVK